jgi:hypothetical protein
MAFGINRKELTAWKNHVMNGDIAFLTHYWIHPKFPHSRTVTKVGCNDVHKLKQWGKNYGLKEEWIHYNPYPHFDLIGERQYDILQREGYGNHIERFRLKREEW